MIREQGDTEARPSAALQTPATVLRGDSSRSGRPEPAYSFGLGGFLLR